MRYIGIDASLSNTGVVMSMPGSDGRVTELASLKPPRAFRGVHRLAWFRAEFTEILVGAPCVVALEGYAFGAKCSREALGELGGVVRLACLDAGIAERDVLIVPPTVLKKYVTGKGNADKAAMLLHVYKRWGVEFADHNLADAYALMQFAMDARAPEAQQTKRVRELVAKVAKEAA